MAATSKLPRVFALRAPAICSSSSSSSSLIACSKTTSAISRSYATASSSAPPRDRDSTSGDNRLEILRKTLYPPGTVSPLSSTTLSTTPTSTPSGKASKSKSKSSASASTSASSSAGGGESEKPLTFENSLRLSSRSNPSTPTGIYRPDSVDRLLQVLDPTRSGRSQEIHETITRAWLLHQRAHRQSLQTSLSAKQDSLERATSALIATGNSKLILSASTKPDVRKQPIVALEKGEKLSAGEKGWHAARVDGMFPRELGKVPRETWAMGEGKKWDYGWKRVRGA